MSEMAGAALRLEGDCLVVQVPLRIRRRGGRKEIIAPESRGDGLPLRSRTNEPLAMMIARAHRWQALLESGRYSSIRELALDVGVDNSYLARVLRLTLLAPDIIESILNGTEPDGLSLGKLYRAPMAWEEQRRVLVAARSMVFSLAS
jgi:hypothetical protein